MAFLTAAAVLVISQTQGPEPNLRCGSYCLYVSLEALDIPVKSFSELEGKLGQPGRAGYSLAQLDEVARSYGAQTLGVETTIENLRRRPGRFACIARIDGNHFVNVADLLDGEAYIVDPPDRDYRVPVDTLRTRWDGTALLISAEPLVAEEALNRGFGWFGYGAVFLAVAVLLAIAFLVLRAGRVMKAGGAR